MSQFYCREDELRKLNKRYAGDKFECIVIYGRRRVGKTALINEFCKDKPTIFFSALNTTGKENLEALSVGSEVIFALVRIFTGEGRNVSRERYGLGALACGSFRRQAQGETYDHLAHTQLGAL